MYSTCLFCNQSLGANDVLEPFPVGRRMAFDTAKGRLWVVCRKCERWNLSPLEERWEVVEACERLFRETRMRVSTENIGLARLHEGLELVRIGQPFRPEFAAWRYGDQFGRRRKRAILYGVGAAAVGGTIVIGGAAAGVISATLLSQSAHFPQVLDLFMNHRTLLKLKTSDGRVIKLKNPELQTAGFVPPSALEDTWRVVIGKGNEAKVFQGEEAGWFAGRMVPRMNRMGGNAAAVQQAVKRLEESGGPEAFLRSSLVDPRVGFSATDPRRGRESHVRARGPEGQPVLRVAKLATPLRLAVEMALHEEQERRTFEGELQALEIAWHEAEQIAAISDDLLLPANAEKFLDQHRSKRPAAAD